MDCSILKRIDDYISNHYPFLYGYINWYLYFGSLIDADKSNKRYIFYFDFSFFSELDECYNILYDLEDYLSSDEVKNDMNKKNIPENSFIGIDDENCKIIFIVDNEKEFWNLFFYVLNTLNRFDKLEEKIEKYNNISPIAF